MFARRTPEFYTNPIRMRNSNKHCLVIAVETLQPLVLVAN